jgi:hypothetical protein
MKVSVTLTPVMYVSFAPVCVCMCVCVCVCVCGSGVVY